MAHHIGVLTSHGTGASIEGIDLAERHDDPQVRQLLNDALNRHHVLAIRGQRLSAEQFLRAARVFGEVMTHHRAAGYSADHKDVYQVRNRRISDTEQFIVGDTFHSDHSNARIPPRATTLHALALPSSGGDTQFVNTHLAYDELPQATKRRIDGLKALHVYQSSYSPRALQKLSDATPGESALHPLVRTHPENGRKFLFVNPVRIQSIPGMPDDEAQALIAELMAHATQQKYEYRHRWLHGDMVIWDNRSVLHKANGDYSPNEDRHLYRLMIEGSLPPDESPEEKTATQSAG
ncbi:TauD/TfdA family dioxygenase [Pigmentiphaga soli]|uniref:TauD/TfdA family dioxygenase n=1 Tax=Pigmentiphaga soli TaxID=1007095 RepID=A0ABP8GYE3_9BURK